MKREQVDESVRKFKVGVAAWGDIKEAIENAMRAADGIPLMNGPLKRLQRALTRLDQLGDVVACVPELAESILEEKNISAQLRQEAQRQGVVLRYD